MKTKRNKILRKLVTIKWDAKSSFLNQRHSPCATEQRIMRSQCAKHLAMSKTQFIAVLSKSSSSSVLSGIVPSAKMAGFTPFLLQLLQLRLSTCLDLGHPPSSNQSSLPPPPPLASSRSSPVVLVFSCHSHQDPEQPSKHYRHPSSAHAHTI